MSQEIPADALHALEAELHYEFSQVKLFIQALTQPPTPSWGNMISAAQSVIDFLPIYSIMPGVAIIITVITFNIFGDGLRDALDPKLRV